jgi:dynein heavy chain
VLKEMLGSFYRMDIFYDNYKFSSVQEYHIPDVSVLESLDDATEFISQLPEVSTPELFGLHPNAAITQAYLETSNLISSLVQVGMVDGGGGG